MSLVTPCVFEKQLEYMVCDMSLSLPTIHEDIIGPSSPGNPRNGEGGMVLLRDGRLLLAYTHVNEPGSDFPVDRVPFHAQEQEATRDHGSDHFPAEIYARLSDDDGYTWGETFLFQENLGALNVMGAAFLRLHSGDILFAFAIKNHSTRDMRGYVRRSSDEGQTWSDPVLATPDEGYICINQGSRCLLQTSNGRILLPASRSTIVPTSTSEHAYHGVVSCFYSDDEGATWHRSAEYMDLPASANGLQEPAIVEVADGSLWMYMRTDLGAIYSCGSTDEGESWSKPEPTELVAPRSPASAVRLPDSHDILMVYNDRRGVPYSADQGEVFQWRTPLSSAVSSDAGRTWHHHKTIEPDQTRSYCYTSINFHKDTTLLTYYLGTAGGPNLVDMKLKIIPTRAWTE